MERPIAPAFHDVRKGTDLNSSDPSPLRPVAIIGMGCMFPQAEDLARYWTNIRNKLDSITEVPESHWRVADYFDTDPKAPDRTYAHRGGFLTPVEFPLMEFGIAPHSIEATDTTQLLGLLVARAALEDSGYLDSPAVARDRVSVVLGVTGTLELVIPLGARLGHPIWRRALEASGVDPTTTEEVIERIASSYVGWQEGSFPGLLGNVAAGRIANRLDLRGTNCVVDAACASALAAVHLAVLELASGRCDLAVTGGLDTFNDIFMYMCFSKTPALSPSGDARPFDARADGTILGEGLGVLVLKRLDEARRDGDKIYAVIRSIGTSSDGKGQAVYAPTAAGQAQALDRAYQLAGFSPATVDLVEAHGTGTKVGDSVELAALEEVYGRARARDAWCALGSVKSQIGHTKAAAGAAGVIKAALALYHKVLPPTLKVEEPIEQLAGGGSPFYLNADPRPWLSSSAHPRRAAVSAFGFGGSNFHCVLEEASAEAAAPDWDGDVQILAYTADDPREIITALEALATARDWALTRHQASQSRSRYRSDHHYRLLMVADRTSADLSSLCASARAALEGLRTAPPERPTTMIKTPVAAGRVILGAGARPGALAMLFPGQGSQYAGMLRGLACQFPQMRAALDLMNELIAPAGGSLADLIYPKTAFTERERRASELKLRQTQVAQPALAAISLGLLRVLDDFGVRADLTGGHSFGELPALRAAGRIDDRSLLVLARRRGELLAGCAGDDGQGEMLAVFAAVDDVGELVRDHALDVVIANKNAPRQCVLAGPAVEIERCRQVLSERKIPNQPLAVSAAFHSRAVAAAEGPLRAALDSIAFQPATIPVFANTTAEPYPGDADAARSLLAGQVARPVEFVAQVEAMYRQGARAFLEVGPDTKLSALVASILDGREHVALAVDASRGKSSNQYDLACALATLAALGYAVDLTRWDDASKPRPPIARKQGLSVKVSGANAWPRSPVREEPNAYPTQTVAPRAERFLLPEGGSTARSPLAAPPDHSENDRTMNPLDRDQIRHANGQTFAPLKIPAEPFGPMGPSQQDGAANPGRDSLAHALKDAQDNLVALQKLAEQTAEIHRQFLVGQEKAQQTFVRLLEYHERLSLAMLGQQPATGPLLSSRAASSPVLGDDEVATACGHRAGGETEHATSARDHNGKPEPAPTPGHSPRTVMEPAPTASHRLSADAAAAILIEVVADKTGYPAEVIGLDMQLDADLGIDSIKRVEILSAWQERVPELPTIKPEQLGSFRTLRAVVEYVNHDHPDGQPVAIEPKAANGQPPAAVGDEVSRVLIESVAEKTGYPPEMLDLDMRLDTDLGIDSIKRVEILSAVQERLPNAPAIGPTQLGALVTLRQVALALLDGPSAAPPISVLEQPRAMGDGHHSNGVTHSRLTTLRSSQPCARALAGALDREHVALPAGATVWISADGSPLTDAVKGALAKKGYRPRVIQLDEAEVTSLEGHERPSGLIVLAPARPRADSFVAPLFRLIRAAGRSLCQSSLHGGAALLTVSRLDGSFGLSGLGPQIDPASGALAGMAKTAAHEWPGVACKAVDLDPAFDSPEQAAGMIVEELLWRGPAEVGVKHDRRIMIGLEPIDDAGGPISSDGCLRLKRGDLIVVSGGARGITAEVAVALAESFQPRLVLLGRSPAPGPEPAWRAAIHNEAELKRVLLDRCDRDRRLTPRDVGDQVARITREREVRRNLARIEAAGSEVFYRSVDVRDADAVRAVLGESARQHGPVRGLIHGAGALADRRITDQTDEQFDLVYDTKVRGLENLLAALDPGSLACLIMFSSSTARFGRAGQVAYAAANEVLNKHAQQLARALPDCRVVSYNWGPWAGGMVTDALAPLFEKEGISLISPAAGARLVVDDLGRDCAGPVEVVVLAENPVETHTQSERQTPSATVTAPAPAPDRPVQTVFERSVDLDSVPVLASHVIDGHAVLPMAIIMEWMAEAAVHRNPGMVLRGLDGVRLFKGVILNDHKPARVDVRAGKPVRRGEEFIVPVELHGTMAGGRAVTHARAEVVLADALSTGRRRLRDHGLASYPGSLEEIYQTILFHGPDLRGIERVEGCNATAIAGWVATAPAPAEWIDQPFQNTWLTEPLALDSAFQLVVLWCREKLGANSLPTAVGSYCQFRRAFPAEGVRVVAEIQNSTDTRAVADLEFLDARGDLVARVDGYECVIDSSLNQAFRRNRLVSRVPVLPS
jgi:acyl transferase domain-containing protein/NADP-dependent 3-hydroxy acid dehydrogenase YdfG